MAQKTLIFKKTKTILSDDKMANTTIIKVGGSGPKFTMKDFQDIPGHDDSLPYVGTLCYNGIPFLKCYNDGWGGSTGLTYIEGCGLNQAEIEAEVFKYRWKDVRYSDCVNLTLDFIADILADGLTKC